MTIDQPADIGAHYRASRQRMSDLITTAGPGSWARPVPACPGWTVADVVAHLVGVIEDAVAGRIDGPPGPTQTASQVARHRGKPADQLIAYWARIAPPFEDAISARAVVPAFLDVLSHEHDVRAALDQAGERGNPSVVFAAERLPQPTSMTSLPATSGSAAMSLSGRLYSPHVNPAANQCRLPASTGG